MIISEHALITVAVEMITIGTSGCAGGWITFDIEPSDWKRPQFWLLLHSRLIIFGRNTAKFPGLRAKAAVEERCAIKRTVDRHSQYELSDPKNVTTREQENDS
jgi:hypothetical protein